MLRPFRPRRFHRAGEGLPALCGATPFRARALRRCGGCLLLSPGTRITRLSPFAGAETSTTRLAVQGTAGPFAIN
ncbi:TPA: single-stranded DNA-binding protein, partial [Klebsiella pneumoniae]|nr:single-stranded DNA-binding protein [Klebsiella pneumoniae]